MSEDAGLTQSNIAGRFQQQAAKTPDNIAVKTGDHSVSYRELNGMAERIAGLLGGGSPSGRPVAIFMDEGPLLIAAIFAVLARGRAFVPLEARLPEARIAAVLSASGASHVLTDSPRLQTIRRVASVAVEVIEAGTYTVAAPFEGFAPVPSDAPASIIYTSGSTGRPKGVVISHAQLLHGVNVRTRLFGVTASDRFAHVRSNGSSASINGLLLSLLNGVTCSVFDLQRQGLQNLGPWMVSENITAIRMACSLLRAWLRSMPEDFKIPSLRVVHAGAESLYGSDIAMAARHLVGDWRIVHNLSSTETGMMCGYAMGPHTIPEPGILPAGYPIEGAEISLIPEPETQTPGVGEITVRSRYISLGYWNEPDLTAAAFATDPIDNTVRTYRTGDLGRWRADGSLEYLGRKTRKIKLSGYSVEPYEIENALLRMEGVHDAVVVPHGGAADRHLAAYIAAADAVRPTSESIRRHLAATLPSYMMPKHIVILDAFPLTTRGKVDIGALPPPEETHDAGHPHRAPQTEEERLLAAIWQDILQRPQIGVDDDFYALGGTSLQAFQIFARIASVFGHDFPPTVMIETPTVAKQAAFLTRSAGNDRATQLVPFRREGEARPLFFVHGAYGDIMFAREISHHIASGRPVFGLQPPPLDGAHHVPRTMEAIAASYIDEILKVQPRGPYLLAGYSFGGMAALEIAQQLTRRGEHVAFLGLIDTTLDGRFEVANEDAAARAARHMRQMRGTAMLPYIAARLRKTLTYYGHKARLAGSQLPNEVRSKLGRPIPYSERAERYRHVYVSASRKYRAQPYAGAIVLFSGEGRAEWHRNRWTRIARGGLSVHEIAANHLDIVWPPHSAQLGKLIDACLSSAETCPGTRA